MSVSESASDLYNFLSYLHRGLSYLYNLLKYWIIIIIINRLWATPRPKIGRKTVMSPRWS